MFFTFLMIAICAVGHLGFWTVLFNQSQATSWPRKIRKLIEALVALIVVLIPFYILTRVSFDSRFSWHEATSLFRVWPDVAAYAYLTVVSAAGVTVLGVWRLLWKRKMSRRLLLSRKVEYVDVQKLLGTSMIGDATTQVLGRVPMTEIFKLSVEQVELGFPELHDALDGYSFSLISDLHYSGQIKESYFDEVVRRVNELKSDAILIAGDMVDKHHCLDWVERTLGKLDARDGVFYVFGNHERRLGDGKPLREILDQCNIKRLAGEIETIRVDDARIQLTGIELPWFPQFGVREDLDPNTFRFLVSHTPDHVYWAAEQGFDMMVAGHVHGGQIQLPIFGAMVAPSKYGAAFANGPFKIGDTAMYVSRGVSGVEPIRWNCYPEITKITLRRV